MAKLTEEHIEALGGALSLAARVGGTYEVYGGVDVTKTISAGNEAVEILQDSRVVVTPKGQVQSEPQVPAESVDTGNMPAPEDNRVFLTPRMCCKDCDAFVGYSHAEGCKHRPGVVQSVQTTEKWTTLEKSDEHPGVSPVYPQMGDTPPMDCDDPLTTLLYLLMRDNVQPGDLEHRVGEVESGEGKGVTLTNRFLGEYAKNLSERITAAAGRRLSVMEKSE